MFALDIRTLLVLAVMSNVLLALGLSIIGRAIRNEVSTRLWAWGAWAGSAAYLLITLRGSIPDLWSILLANALLIAAFDLYFLGSRRFLDLPVTRRWDLALAAIAVAAMAYFTYAVPDLTARIVVMSLALALLALANAWLMLRLSPGGGPRLERRFVGVAFLAIALLLTLRAVLALNAGAERQDFMQADNVADGLFMALVTGFNICLAILLPLMVIDGVRRRQQESDARFREVFDAVSDAIFVHDAETGQILDVNQRMCEMYGLSREQALACGPAELSAGTAPYTAADALAWINKTLNEGPQTFDWLARAHDGRQFWVQVSLRLAQIAGRQRILAVVRDIGARKLAEQQLTEHHALLQTILDSLPMRVFWKDIDLRYQGCNTLFARDAGLASPEEMLGKNDRELVWRDQAMLYQADDLQVMSSGQPKLAYEEPQSTPDGQLIWLRTSKFPLLDASGLTIGVLGLYEDISAEKATEGKLHLQQAALEAAANTIVITDKEGVIEWVNPAFTTLTGYDIDEAVGHTPGELLRSGRHDQTFYEDMWRTILSGRLWHGDIINRRKDGTFFEEEMTITPVRNAAGRIRHYVAVKQDITARKALEHRLSDSEAQANLIINTSPDAIILFDDAGRMVRVNPQAEVLFGYGVREMLGQAVEMLIPERLRETHVRLREEYMAHPVYRAVREHGRDSPLMGRRKDGSEFPFEGSLSSIQLGEAQYVVATIRDISARKQAETTIRQDREQQATLRELLENVLRGGTLEATLERCLEQLLSISWLTILPKGGIFLTQEQGKTLRLAVAHNLAEGVLSRCAFLPFGTCHCGQAATSGKVQYAHCVDDRHEIVYPGMVDHGHYSLPLVSDGEVLGVLVLYLPLEFRPDTGKEQFLASVADILAGFIRRKQADLALERHQHDLEAMVTQRTAQVRQQARIIDQSHESVVSTDLDGIVTSWNSGAERMFGIPSADAIGRHIRMVYPPEEHDFLQHQVIEPLQAKGQHEVEVRMQRADGTPFQALLSLSMLHDDNGIATGMIGFSLDISARKRMEDALRESEANLAQAQAIAHMGSWTLDIVDDNLAWSAETYRIFAMEPGTALHLADFLDCTHVDDRAQVEAAWNNALAGQDYDIEHRIVAAGQVKWVREQATVSFDHAGRPIMAVGSVQDITQIKQAELATQAALAQAQRLAQAKSDFLANMSHEIRTPLNAVLGLAKIGARDHDGQVPGKTFARILDSGQHLLGVINDILEFSRIEAGKFAIEPRPFHLDATIQAAVDMVAQRAEVKGLSLPVTVVSGLPPWVTGDPLRLQQILVNLLANAVKFTEHGEVHLRVAREGNDTWFRVIDPGIGMTAEQVQRLFTPFEQADSSTTRRYGGSGLGLAISQNLAKLMGGEISVESRPGEGSTFTLRLPLAAAKPDLGHAAEADASAGPQLEHVRVLAAEDMEVNRLVLEDLLVHEGAHVVFAENGRQTLERLDELGVTAFDVVLMDVQMPVMDGLEATRRIRELAPALPIIGLTAHALDEERDRCLAAGMVEHITKPIDMAELVASIRRHVPQPGASPVPATTPSFSALAQESDAPVAPSAAAEGEHPVIDWETLRQRYKGRQSFIDKLANTVLQANADTPGKLRAAVQAGDLPAIAFIAHSLKGMAGNLMAQGLQELARETEHAARCGQDNAPGLGNALASVMERLLTELAQR